MPAAVPNQVRCAIYTRKSTEEGLDQEFNTLDAQREAGESYINSQRHDGWIVSPDRYDDGGFTGANTDRPALQRLLADVEAGNINCIVVYKVDRFSRALLDFMKMMEILDRHGVTFVSVTQPFNTTTSPGRLLLNMLFSFAQFEREMISERTRDKMRAARRKGKWIGGNLSLGYDLSPKGGSLAINGNEAEQVREIFRLYLELGSLIPLVAELDRRGWTMKKWTNLEGKQSGGARFTKTTLHNLLTNVIYTGRVKFDGKLLDGEHERIVDDDTWNRVQEQLNRNGRHSGRNVRNKCGALLKGLVRCASCNCGMTHTYAQKPGQAALSLLRLHQRAPARLEQLRDALGIRTSPRRLGCGTGPRLCPAAGDAVGSLAPARTRPPAERRRFNAHGRPRRGERSSYEVRSAVGTTQHMGTGARHTGSGERSQV
jgi:site-specific DNA recombinase